MAVHPKVSASPQVTDPGSMPAQPIDVQAWTEQAIQSLNVISVASSGRVRGTSVSVAIDLDERAKRSATSGEGATDAYRPRRKLLRRDSLERREALLKGKEGSRRRTRWENDRLLNNPWTQPPLPSDWEVHPTYQKHNVPYYLAPLWEHDLAAGAEAQKKKQAAARKAAQAMDEGQGKIPKELRERLKKAKAAKGLLRDLEEQVRLFVENWEEKMRLGKEKERKKKHEIRENELDSEDDEIVFIGRNGQMHDVPPSPKFRDSEDEDEEEDEHRVERDRLVFDSLANDHSARFGRWLVHSIASYYGLRTWSRTIGDPARREAYVGIPPVETAGRSVSNTLPRPLWGLV